MVKNRPLSPHLTIYRPQVTSVLSIFHRITGVILSIITSLTILLYKQSIYYISIYNLYKLIYFVNLSSHGLVFSIAFIVLISTWYHTFNGIRHLIWDSGYNLNLNAVYYSGYIIIILTFVSSIITWIYLIN